MGVLLLLLSAPLVVLVYAVCCVHESRSVSLTQQLLLLCVRLLPLQFGGRYKESVVNDASLLTVYDIRNNAWITPSNVSGTPPCPRSSHRAVVYNGRIILYGGAGEAKGVKARMGDVHSLVLSQKGQLVWCECDTPQPGEGMPDGRCVLGVQEAGCSLKGESAGILPGHVVVCAMFCTVCRC